MSPGSCHGTVTFIQGSKPAAQRGHTFRNARCEFRRGCRCVLKAARLRTRNIAIRCEFESRYTQLCSPRATPAEGFDPRFHDIDCSTTEGGQACLWHARQGIYLYSSGNTASHILLFAEQKTFWGHRRLHRRGSKGQPQILEMRAHSPPRTLITPQGRYSPVPHVRNLFHSRSDQSICCPYL